MNFLKQISIISAIGAFIIPQVAFGAWWNPFAWQWQQPKPAPASQDIFSTVSNQASEIEKLKQEIEVLKKPAAPAKAKLKNSPIVIEKSEPRPLAKKSAAIQSTITVAPFGPVTNRPRAQSDDIVFITISSADTDIAIKSLSITLKGDALKSGVSTPVSLIDTNTNALWGSSIIQRCVFNDAGSCTLIFTPDFIVSRNTNKAIRIMISSTAFESSSFKDLAIKIEVPDTAWSDKSSLGEIRLAYSSSPSIIANAKNGDEPQNPEVKERMQKLQDLLNSMTKLEQEYQGKLSNGVLYAPYSNEYANKKLALFDQLAVQIKAILRVPNISSQFSSKLNEILDALTFKREDIIRYLSTPIAPINITPFPFIPPSSDASDFIRDMNRAPSYSPPAMPFYQSPLKTRCEYDRFTGVTNCNTSNW